MYEQQPPQIFTRFTSHVSFWIILSTSAESHHVPFTHAPINPTEKGFFFRIIHLRLSRVPPENIHSPLLWCHFITAHVLTSAYTIYISTLCTHSGFTVLLLLLQGLWCQIVFSVWVTERGPATPPNIRGNGSGTLWKLINSSVTSCLLFTDYCDSFTYNGSISEQDIYCLGEPPPPLNTDWHFIDSV